MKEKFDIDQIMDGVMSKVEQSCINAFIYVGNKCISNAREEGSYMDNTGNLRNSTGYVVLLNGKVVQRKHLSDLNREVIEELTAKYSKGIVLAVVAGMNYAVYVEAKNYNVLTSAELLAEKLVPKMLKDLGLKV